MCCFGILFVGGYFLILGSLLRIIIDRVAKVYLAFRDAMQIAFIVGATNMTIFWVFMAVSAFILPAPTRQKFDPITLLATAIGQVLCLIVDVFLFARLVRSPVTRQPIGLSKGAAIATVLFAVNVIWNVLVNLFFFVVLSI